MALPFGALAGEKRGPHRDPEGNGWTLSSSSTGSYQASRSQGIRTSRDATLRKASEEVGKQIPITQPLVGNYRLMGTEKRKPGCEEDVSWAALELDLVSVGRSSWSGDQARTASAKQAEHRGKRKGLAMQNGAEPRVLGTLLGTHPHPQKGCRRGAVGAGGCLAPGGTQAVLGAAWVVTGHDLVSHCPGTRMVRVRGWGRTEKGLT